MTESKRNRKKESSLARRYRQLKRKRAEHRYEKELRKEGRTQKSRQIERGKFRTIERKLDIAILVVAILLIVMVLMVLYV